MSPLPQYKCHKVVGALKIKAVVDSTMPRSEADGTRSIVPEDGRYSPFHVSADYVRRHKPQAGGYYVSYEDGYESYSPAEAFESGYTLIP